MFEGPDEVASISPLTFLYSISEIGVDFGGVFYWLFRFPLVISWCESQAMGYPVPYPGEVGLPKWVIPLYLRISTNALIFLGVFSEILLLFPIYFIVILYRITFWVIPWLENIGPWGALTVYSIVILLTPAPLCPGHRLLRRWYCSQFFSVDMKACSHIYSDRCPWADIPFSLNSK